MVNSKPLRVSTAGEHDKAGSNITETCFMQTPALNLQFHRQYSGIDTCAVGQSASEFSSVAAEFTCS